MLFLSFTFVRGDEAGILASSLLFLHENKYLLSHRENKRTAYDATLLGGALAYAIDFC